MLFLTTVFKATAEEQVIRARRRPAGDTALALDGIWSTSAKRIMVTHTVATAARRLASAEKAEMVRQSFLPCGISGRPDGSDISKIRVKDIPIETVLWDGWDTFNLDKRIKEELANDPEILEDADGDNTEYISTAEDVQQPIGSNPLAPIDLTRPMRPWDL
ncbi:hypothetical protein CI238_13398 [Colletotrichum incanum]|uniref:Uncharacterized protein n=1 Tax=Colletotrichum incanum TaxID=1573173 RepID=A0A162NP34_COLIC|nr:hypothetical protein CI238_13398 [Colletotrichum incanum]